MRSLLVLLVVSLSAQAFEPGRKIVRIVQQQPGAIPLVNSNQDIKDGVNRPDDQLRNNIFSPVGVDYYSEFKAKFKANPPRQ